MRPSLSSGLLMTAALSGTACTNHTLFTGRVYDGASGSRLTDYKLFLEYGRSSMRGNVDRNGRYAVGPLANGHDYTVAIEAEGYRSFLSHNRAIPIPDRCRVTESRTCPPMMSRNSRYYDAYLFPEGLPSPAVTFDITLDDNENLPSGLIRLRPTTLSILYDESGEQRAGITGQVWSNDDDLQARSVTKPFSDGAVTFDEGELVYGVRYVVTVFGIDGYAVRESQYQSGLDGNQAILVSRVADAPLELSFASPDLGLPNAEGTVFLGFNQPIEFDFEERVDAYRKIVDDNFSIFSPGGGNTLPDPGDTSPTRGTGIEIVDNQVILTWDGTLDSSDDDDPIQSVTYGGLDQITIRSVRGPVTNRATIGELLGTVSSPASSITVDLIP